MFDPEYLVNLLLLRPCCSRAPDSVQYPELLRMVLERGIDIWPEDHLAQAICVKAQVLLVRVFRDFRDKIPGFDVQLAKALKCCAREKDARGIGLCLWLGADPRLKASSKTWDDSCKSSALEDAVFEGDLDVIKQLKPDPRKV